MEKSKMVSVKGISNLIERLIQEATKDQNKPFHEMEIGKDKRYFQGMLDGLQQFKKELENSLNINWDNIE